MTKDELRCGEYTGIKYHCGLRGLRGCFYTPCEISQNYLCSMYYVRCVYRSKEMTAQTAQTADLI